MLLRFPTMRTFRCLSCDRPINFDDGTCPHCGAVLGFIPGPGRLVSLLACDDGTWRVTPDAPWDYHPGVLERLFGARSRVVEPEDSGERYCRCANGAQYGNCNWLVPADSDEPWCPACRTSRTIPNLARPGNLELWTRLERAKRRALFDLMRLGLKFQDRHADPEQGLAFDFLSSLDADPGQAVVTGHANGLITIAIDLLGTAGAGGGGGTGAGNGEPVGEFRHLIGYYYWDRLIRDADRFDDFRALFGDERLDYAAAQGQYQRQGAPADWADRHVSAGASSHPWEDWAETWTLCLRIMDVLETTALIGGGADATYVTLGGGVADFPALLEKWLPTAVALNDLDRNLGRPAVLPARLSPTATDKLAFVHRTIRTAAA